MVKLNKGFTLVELLIAIAIFAVLAALGWKIFDHVSDVKERNVAREQVLNEIQVAYQILLKDSVQIVPIAVDVSDSIQPALILQNNQLSFSKGGVVDPLQQGLSPFERIEYHYDEKNKSIIRSRYSSLNHSSNENPESSIFLNHVDELNIAVLNSDELNLWPENTDADSLNLQKLPKGVRFMFTQNGTKYEWIFSLLDTDAVVRNVKTQ